MVEAVVIVGAQTSMLAPQSQTRLGSSGVALDLDSDN